MLLWRRIGEAFLILGWAMISIEGLAILMTVSYTVEQLEGILATNPAWSWNPFLLLPAPMKFRLFGIIFMVLGGFTVAVISAIRYDPDSSAVR
jgi:hypothetical protein